MRYFIPDIRVPAELPPETSAEDKFGGLPWGLPPDAWPKCADCGGSLSLLAQLVHHPVRLDLGRAGRVLFAFQCNHDPGMCSTWEGGSGANACFVVEPESLGSALTALPEDGPLLENELRVDQWIELDDGLSSDLFPAFFDEAKYFALPEEILASISTSTRLGGVPAWMQSPSEAPADGWTFIGQLDSTHSFITPPAGAVPWAPAGADKREGRTHVGQGPNFGDGGIAYLFLRSTAALPEGYFFWQCG